ncbi:MAG: PH domain-containing protein [Chloroflexota bacterium]|nr:PH domain-containing protein [Chloroflexota bacterium]
MDVLTVEPSRKYLTKAYVTIAIIAVAIVLCGLLIGGLISLGEETGVEALWWSLRVTLGLNVLWGVPAVLLMGPYYRSLRYEIHEDQVIMHVGVITRSVKYVPFRTVTNMAVKRDPLDRLFGIGSLQIQTAGISGSTQAEQHLVGLEDPQAAYDLAVRALRRFRGSMSPTAADVDGEDLLRAILDEVRAMRESLER